MTDVASHLVVGAGPLGSAVARALLAAGHEVAVVSRSTPPPTGVTWLRADATRDVGYATGAHVIYQCAQPPYHRWHQEFEPLQRAILAEAQRAGASLVIADNLYGYGTGGGAVITEATPIAPCSRKGELRVRMAAEALEAHRRGAVRVALTRPSTYIGGGYAPFERTVLRPLLAGRTARFLGDVDQPHSFSFVPDAGRAMAVIGTSEHGWGRAWITPVLPTMTARELATSIWHASGREGAAPVSGMGRATVAALGIAIPALRASFEMLYEFTAPHVVDASDAERAFGIRPTPLDTVHRALAAPLP